MRYIILYNFLPSTDGADRGMFLSFYSCSLDFRLKIRRYNIWTTIRGHTRGKPQDFLFFLHFIIAGASSKLLILLVETVTQFARTNIISSTVKPAFYVRNIKLYIFLPSTDGTVRGMFLSSLSCSLDFFRIYIFRYNIWTNPPGSHKRKATGLYFFYSI